MISPCDGCQRIFAVELTVINAKQWKPSICDTPAAESSACRKLDCVCNIEGMCIDFQFCNECLSSQEIIGKAFEEWLA